MAWDKDEDILEFAMLLLSNADAANNFGKEDKDKWEELRRQWLDMYQNIVSVEGLSKNKMNNSLTSWKFPSGEK